MAKSAPDWSDTVRISLSDSEEEVFVKSDSNWRPTRTNRSPDENGKESRPKLGSYGTDKYESREFENHTASYEHSIRSFNETVSYFESLHRQGDSVSRTPANIGRYSTREHGQSESSSYIGTWSEEYGWANCRETELAKQHVHRLEGQRSIVDGLLMEIYDRSHRRRADSVDSDTFTECSSASEAPHGPRWDGHYDLRAQQQAVKRYNRHTLQSYSTRDLRQLREDLQRNVTHMSVRLVRQLKRRDRREARNLRHCDVVTAILQAASLKRQIDTRMKFSVTPPAGPSAFDQWKDAMKAVNRLPLGIPPEFRKKVWLSLADRYINQLKLDWQTTVRLAFNDRSNPDDDTLGLQIVKDLHRTGCSSFSGHDNEEERALLKRVLLAYARWNKRIGYCQGFNVIVALLLDVMDRKEDDALKVMIYLIDHVLPESYFDNNLRALSVDMAVFRDLLRVTLPALSAHLDTLQHAAQDYGTGACYEPPLTNVFTMQWFLTLFATCLPKDVVLRVWDAVLLEGSEILLRTALCLWGQLARRIMTVDSADEFYCLMGDLSSHMMQGSIYDSDSIIKAIYAVAPMPFPQLRELREKYTYNIRPFSSSSTSVPPSRRLARLARAVLSSDEEEPDEEELRALATAFPGMSPAPAAARGKSTDISVVGPGVFGVGGEWSGVGSGVSRHGDTVLVERMSTDMTALKLQYTKLRQRQRQAHVILTEAVSAKKAVEVKQKSQAPVVVPKVDTPLAINHLFVGKVQGRHHSLKRTSSVGASCDSGRGSPITQVPAQTAACSTPFSTPRAKPPFTRSVSFCDTSSRVHYPSANTPSSCSSRRHSSSSARPECSERRKTLHCVQEILQLCDKGKSLCRLPSEPAHDGEATSDNCCVPGSGCLAVNARSVDVGDGQQNTDALSSPSKSENAVSDSKCSKAGEDLQSSEERSEKEKDDGDGLCDQHSSHGETCDIRLPQRRACANDTVSESQDDSASVAQTDPVHSEDCETAEGQSAETPVSEEQSEEIPALTKSEQLAGLNGNLVSANIITTTGMGVKEICGERNGVQHPHTTISRSHSLPTPSPTSPKSFLPPTTTTTSPTRKLPAPLSSIHSPTDGKSRHASSPSASKSPRPFNPFPVRHITASRARTGLKLGLYTPSTLHHIQGQLQGGLVLKKANNASS